MGVGRIFRIGLFGVGVIALFAIAPLLFQFIHYYDSLDQEVAKRFAGQRWTIPSLVYSDSTTIYPGQKINDIALYQRLARLNYHRVAPGQVRSRGEDSFDDKRGGRLEPFLPSLHYPYKQFSGELIAMRI